MNEYPVDHILVHGLEGQHKRLIVSDPQMCQRIWMTFAWVGSLKLGIQPTAPRGGAIEIATDAERFATEYDKTKHFNFLHETHDRLCRRIGESLAIPGSPVTRQASFGFFICPEIRRQIFISQYHPALIRRKARNPDIISGLDSIWSAVRADISITCVALQLIFNELSGPWIAFKEALDCGLAPFAWQGTWPAGKLLAYLPPEAVTPAVAHLVVKSKEELAASTPLPELLESALPAITPSAEDRMLWQRMIDVPRRLLGFWRALAGNDAGDKLLTRVVSRVSGITVENDEMVVSFRPDVSGRVTRLRCQPGFRGKLRLPSTVKWVVALHNGMRFEVAGLETMQTLRWHRSDGKRFAGEWEGIWYTPDRDDPDEPFPAAPLMPFSDGDSLYILDPRHRRADEEPAVVRMGDGGGFGPPLPDPAGVCFLWALDGLTE